MRNELKRAIGVASRASFIPLVAAAMLTSISPATLAQTTTVDLDTVRAGRFDFGKMWTFEYPPGEYFSETYGFSADPEWFQRARLSALRIPGCSASFVSPNGLVATNHHCVRGAVTRVTRDGEDLLDEGFYAAVLDEERRIPAYYADQLIAAEHVSAEVFEATDRADSDVERERLREEMLLAIRTRLKERHAGAGDSVWVQTVPLYHGGRYSAYVFRRFTDVRLVVAAEVQVAFFGGDPDNFTYPRYDLDFAFLRIYDADGEPYRPAHHFGWSEKGVEEGQVVFIIGNPGSTNRLRTVAQLEFQRDVEVPAAVSYLRTRLAALEDYRRADPETAAAMNIENRIFGLSNFLKASLGRLSALNDPLIMARKADAERQLREAVLADSALSAHYGGVFERLAEIQAVKARYAPHYAAFRSLGNPTYESALLRRAFSARPYLEAKAGDSPADTVELLRQDLLRIRDHPAPLEERLLAERLSDFHRFLGADHPITRAALGELDPKEAAEVLLQKSMLRDSTHAALAVEAGTLTDVDPGLRVLGVLLPEYSEFVTTVRRLEREESELESDLGRLRFEVYGRRVPPDGTFSPRITDGVVKGYEYNGTYAPPYTTFYGIYDHYASYGPGSAWDLPERWRTPPPALDLSTPLNFVSTADTYGGNSGSPAVTAGLELVGLNFDRNIEGLSRDFIYLPERGRNVMVDVRAIREALDHAYDADRIVLELLTGRLYETETAADAAAR